MSERTGGQGRVFGAYANFYDALYADKDYDAEVDFLERVFAEHGVAAGARVLDLGSGTGNHDLPLARRGYRVSGVDRSADMAAVARGKAAAEAIDIEFVVDDVRTVRLPERFDAVISMFAVASYMLTNDDLIAMFETVRAHLGPGGLFVFDGWFGPAVLIDPPKVARKTVTDASGATIERTATPEMDVVAQTVQVAYEVVRTIGDQVTTTAETHTMRFLFAQELAFLLHAAGFTLAAFGPFMDLSRPATASDWTFSAVARAIDGRDAS